MLRLDHWFRSAWQRVRGTPAVIALAFPLVLSGWLYLWLSSLGFLGFRSRVQEHLFDPYIFSLLADAQTFWQVGLAYVRLVAYFHGVTLWPYLAAYLIQFVDIVIWLWVGTFIIDQVRPGYRHPPRWPESATVAFRKWLHVFVIFLVTYGPLLFIMRMYDLSNFVALSLDILDEAPTPPSGLTKIWKWLAWTWALAAWQACVQEDRTVVDALREAGRVGLRLPLAVGGLGLGTWVGLILLEWVGNAPLVPLMPWALMARGQDAWIVGILSAMGTFWASAMGVVGWIGIWALWAQAWPDLRRAAEALE